MLSRARYFVPYSSVSPCMAAPYVARSNHAPHARQPAARDLAHRSHEPIRHGSLRLLRMRPYSDQEAEHDITDPGQSADERSLSTGQQADLQRLDAKPARGETRRLSLALQGGGSLGAFAWGVLDRLLEQEDLTFDAVSGASVGAVNAVIVAAGLLAGGKPEARRRLDHFWER